MISRQGIAVTAAALQELFGERLVAVIAGVKDAKAVGRWARGEDIPTLRLPPRCRTPCTWSSSFARRKMTRPFAPGFVA